MSNRTLKAIVPTAIILILMLSAYVWHSGQFSTAPPEKITIGSNRIGVSGLLFIALQQGYDKEQGLELQLKPYQAGRDAARDVVSAGRIDVGCCAEFVLVSEAFAGAADLRGLAVFGSGDIHALTARLDRGINRPADLRGKTIGLPLKTSAEFFLGRFLTFNNIALKEVNLVDVNPSDLPGALVGGKVDAVMAWEPDTYDILTKAGQDAIQWPAQGGQDCYWLLVSREEVLKNKTVAIEKLLRALKQAENFAKQQPEASRVIITQWLQIPVSELVKFPKKYDLFLNQALLLAMEDQARWTIRNKLTDQTRMPNYLDYVNAEALMKVDPKAVRVVLPGKGTPK